MPSTPPGSNEGAASGRADLSAADDADILNALQVIRAAVTASLGGCSDDVVVEMVRSTSLNPMSLVGITCGLVTSLITDLADIRDEDPLEMWSRWIIDDVRDAG